MQNSSCDFEMKPFFKNAFPTLKIVLPIVRSAATQPSKPLPLADDVVAKMTEVLHQAPISINGGKAPR